MHRAGNMRRSIERSHSHNRSVRRKHKRKLREYFGTKYPGPDPETGVITRFIPGAAGVLPSKRISQQPRSIKSPTTEWRTLYSDIIEIHMIPNHEYPQELGLNKEVEIEEEDHHDNRQMQVLENSDEDPLGDSHSSGQYLSPLSDRRLVQYEQPDEDAYEEDHVPITILAAPGSGQSTSSASGESVAVPPEYPPAGFVYQYDTIPSPDQQSTPRYYDPQPGLATDEGQALCTSKAFLNPRENSPVSPDEHVQELTNWFNVPGTRITEILCEKRQNDAVRDSSGMANYANESFGYLEDVSQADTCDAAECAYYQDDNKFVPELIIGEHSEQFYPKASEHEVEENMFQVYTDSPPNTGENEPTSSFPIYTPEDTEENQYGEASTYTTDSVVETLSREPSASFTTYSDSLQEPVASFTLKATPSTSFEDDSTMYITQNESQTYENLTTTLCRRTAPTRVHPSVASQQAESEYSNPATCSPASMEKVNLIMKIIEKSDADERKAMYIRMKLHQEKNQDFLRSCLLSLANAESLI